MRDLFQIAKETTVADTYDATRRVPVPTGQRVINGLKYVGKRQFFGKAVTLKLLPSRTDMNKITSERAQKEFGVSSLRSHAISLCDENSVLVVDASGYNHSAIGGSTSMSSLAARGAQAIISDGAIRDREDFKEYSNKYGLSLAVADFTVQSGTGSALYPYDVQIPVSVHGVLIRPDDYIFGDEDGILVIPKGVAEDVLECGIMVAKFDKYIRILSEEKGLIQGKDIDVSSPDFINPFLQWAQFTPLQLEMYNKYQRPKR